MKLKIESETEMVNNGSLSQLHLETVYYACQRHEMYLENGYRGGFFLGDGAGVGKGRQIAAIIIENFLKYFYIIIVEIKKIYGLVYQMIYILMLKEILEI